MQLGKNKLTELKASIKPSYNSMTIFKCLKLVDCIVNTMINYLYLQKMELLICVCLSGCSKKSLNENKSIENSILPSSLENQLLTPPITSPSFNQINSVSPIITQNVTNKLIPSRKNLFENRELQIISTSDNGKISSYIDINMRNYNNLEKRVLSGEMVLLDKNQNIFLDMDNEREKISYKITNLENGEHSYSLQVNSCIIEGTVGYGSGNLYGVCLSGTKGLPTIQLLIESGGESFGYEYKVFCYDQIGEQESLQYIGTVKSSRNEIFSINGRSFSFWGWSDIFPNYNWEEEQEYVLCKEKYDNYYGIGNLPISCSMIGDILILNKDLYVYTTRNFDEYCGIIEKGSKIMMVAYDGEHCIYIEDFLTTLNGWIKLVTDSSGEMKIISGDQEFSAEELFEEAIFEGDK